jgi:hypothetical protein
VRGYTAVATIADYYAPGDSRVIYTKRLAKPHHEGAVHFHDRALESSRNE